MRPVSANSSTPTLGFPPPPSTPTESPLHLPPCDVAQLQHVVQVRLACEGMPLPCLPAGTYAPAIKIHATPDLARARQQYPKRTCCQNVRGHSCVWPLSAPTSNIPHRRGDKKCLGGCPDLGQGFATHEKSPPRKWQHRPMLALLFLGSKLCVVGLGLRRPSTSAGKGGVGPFRQQIQPGGIFMQFGGGARGIGGAA